MSKKVIDLADEIIKCRDIELPQKLLKLREIVLYNDDPKKTKSDIYKYDLLDVLSVSFKNEYGYINDGWSIAVDLVKIFCLCVTDFVTSEKAFENVLMPNAVENILILAKKLQEKHFKSRVVNDEFVLLFRVLIKEYSKIALNQPFIAKNCLKSQRLFQLLLSDDQIMSSIVISCYNDLFNIKRNNIKQMDDKTLNSFLDEIIYKIATFENRDAGIAIFQLLNTMCQLDDNIIKIIVRRYKAIKLLINKWNDKAIGNDLTEFVKLWENADKNKYNDEYLHNKAVMIQKFWKGYLVRKELKQKNDDAARIQKKFRQRKEKEEEIKQKKLAEEELRFQLLLEHRRRQRQRKMEQAALIEILAPNQIEKFLEKQREYSATLIQAYYKGYKTRKSFKNKKEKAVQIKAAICIQQAVRRFLERLKSKRKQPAFYSRPAGLDSARREFLFDKIRQYVDSLPPHPRSEQDSQALHDKAQRMFHDYVLSQRAMRQQQQNTQVLLALANNDADLILNAPKLSDVTEDDVNNYFSHKSKPVILAAKNQHLHMLRKNKAKWFELLMDDSDSDEELYDEASEELENNLRNLNFNSNTENYYSAANKGKHGKYLGYSTSNAFHLNHGIPIRERNQLKTNNLRKNITQMMVQDPQKSHVWNDNLFETSNKNNK